MPRVIDDVDIEGERARLRPVLPRDAAAAFPMLDGRREVLDWLIWRGPASATDLERTYAEWRAESGDGVAYHLAVVERATDRFVGAVTLRFEDASPVASIGYWIGAEHWGRGLGTEAVALLARLAFGRLDAALLTAEVFGGNAASERVLEKNGFERTRAPRGGVSGDSERIAWVFTLTRSAHARNSAPRGKESGATASHGDCSRTERPDLAPDLGAGRPPRTP